MRRREFIRLIGGAAAAWPIAARTQQPAMPAVGYLSSGSAGERFHANLLASFHRGIGSAGYVEGRNVAIEYRFAQGQFDRLRALAADLVRRRVAVIAATGSSLTALAAKAETSTIPIVFDVGVDPVALGLVDSLNRPGGNATGVSLLSAEVTAKRLQLLRELVPTAASIALLVNPANLLLMEVETRAAQVAARNLGVDLLVLNASDRREIEEAFATFVQRGFRAALVSADPIFNTAYNQIVELAARHTMPTMCQYREFPVAGGLMSYGSSLADAYRLVGAYTGRILRGERPTDLPVQQSVKIELVINVKTAKSRGLNVPPTLLALADEVIE